jgi:protein disulfide-isomerase
MANVRVDLVVAVMMVALAERTFADEATAVAWRTDLNAAWATTCKEGRPLLVFVTREDCAFCTQMKGRTYGNAVVAQLVNRSFVPLVLDGRQPLPLLRELNVKYYPSTFVISPQAVVLARYDGYVSPEDLARRLSLLRPPAAVGNVAHGR